MKKCFDSWLIAHFHIRRTLHSSPIYDEWHAQLARIYLYSVYERASQDDGTPQPTGQFQVGALM